MTAYSVPGAVSVVPKTFSFCTTRRLEACELAHCNHGAGGVPSAPELAALSSRWQAAALPSRCCVQRCKASAECVDWCDAACMHACGQARCRCKVKCGSPPGRR